MAAHGLTFLFTILMWWLGTGVVLLICTRPEKTFGWSLFGGTLMLIAALYGVAHMSREAGPTGSYLSFLSALGVWGFVEMSFLMGFVTGPRTTPCPAGSEGWQRFRLALETLLYHELAIVAAAGAIVYLTWGAPNQTGTFAFLILMAMRISAKLNIFLGVPNLTDSLLPERLSYLKSYFRKRSFNLLFPVSILGATFVAVELAQKALGAESGEREGPALLFALLMLAILEHFFMMVPVQDQALWQWAMPSGGGKPPGKRLP